MEYIKTHLKKGKKEVMMKVLNYGSMNLDYVYQVDHIVTGGETSAALSMEVHLGGKGFNQTIALAKAGVPVHMAGTIGEEGNLFLERCKKEGVSTKFVQQIEGKSGHTIIQVDKNAQNSILLFGGSNQKQNREWIDYVLSHFEKGDMLLLQNEINELPYLIDKAFERGMIIVLNPSPFDVRLEKCNLNKIHFFIMNEIEGALLTGKETFEDILREMRTLYPKAKVVLTVGSQGSFYQDEVRQIFQKIYPVQAVDTTAAGDTFTGYFIGGIVNGWEITKVMDLCAKASSLAVSKKGAADSIPELKEVME